MNLDYLTENWREILRLTVDHVELSGIAILIALLIAAPISAFVIAVRPATFPTFGFLGAVYTIPSLALLAFLISIPNLGLGRRSAIVMLAAYAQLALVRNIVAAMRGVDPAVLEAARGTGMTNWQVFRRVRLPLALPILIAGIRIAMVSTVSLATIAGVAGGGGLGEVLFDGMSRRYASEILAGTIAITALALATDLILRIVERMTPAGRAARAVRG
ncbi:MAG: ABC transporter permease [Thermomicrobiales bacterium]